MELIRTNLGDSPHYLEQVIALIQTEFNYPKDQSFVVDFAPLFSERNLKNCHILLNNGEVIAHVGCKPRTIIYKDISSPVVLIGGIAVKSTYQKRGIFSELFSKIIDIYKDEISMFLLWGSETHLYQKFGFIEAGEIYFHEGVPIDKAQGFSRHKLKDLSLEDLQQIKNLYNDTICSNFLTLQRDNLDWADLEKIYSSELYINKQSDKIISYFLYGKGGDLKSIIHEACFRNDQMAMVVSNLNKFNLWYPTNIIPADPKNVMFATFIKPGAYFPSFIEKLSRNTISDLSLKDQMIHFSFHNNKYSLSIADFMTGIFGPNRIAEFQNIFPSLFFGGLDSI